VPDSNVKLKIQADATQLVAEIKRAKQSVNDLGSGMATMRTLATRAVGILGAYASVSAIKGLAEIGAKALQAETAFRNATDNLQIDADAWVKALKEATRGTVDESDLMQKAMKGITGGLSQDQITKLADISTVAAIRMGEDVGDAFADIVDAVEMMKTKTLVKYGLITKAQMEIVDSAKKAGEEVDMFRVIMENTANQKALIGTLDETSLAFQRAKAASKDFWESLGKEIAGVIGQAYEVATIIKNLFSAEGRAANRRQADEKLSTIAMNQTYMPGPYGGLGPLKTPYTDSLKNAEARKKAADDAAKQADAIRKVTESLKFQYDQLLRLEKEQDIYNALQKAGVTLDSAKGQEIAALVSKNYEYKQSMEDTRIEAEAMTKNIQNNAIERQKLLEALDKEIVALEQELAIFGMSAKDATLYKLAIQGASEEQLKLAESVLSTMDRMQRIKTINEELITPQEKYNERVKELKEYLDGFAITWDQYTLGMKKAKDELESATKTQKDQLSDLQRAIEGWGRDSADAIVDFALEGKTSFADMAKSIIADMMKMIIYQQMLKPLFDSISTAAGGSWLGNLFGPGKAFGGAVSPGKLYEVNERGAPEILSTGGRQFLMMGENSGYVHAAKSIAAAGGGSGSGSGSAPVINIINNAGAEVTTQSRDNNGGIELDVMIDRAVASKLGQFGSSSNKVMRQNFTTSQRLVNR
jgi:hypothetical protein